MQPGRDELDRRLAALDEAKVMLRAEYPGHDSGRRSPQRRVAFWLSRGTIGITSQDASMRS